LRRIGLIFAFFLAAGPGFAQSDYTRLDFDSCEVIATYEEAGGIDLKCPGYGGFAVYVSEGDARMDVDYGAPSGAFETFFAFNAVGETIEWFYDINGVQAAALRFFIDVDGRNAQALVVSKVGLPGDPGCVVGIVDAALEQANGMARGIGLMAPLFDCAVDRVVIAPGASELVAGFGGANR
jgi:hypothetical protein